MRIEFIRDQFFDWFSPEFNDAMFRHFNDTMPDRRCDIEDHLLRVACWRNL